MKAKENNEPKTVRYRVVSDRRSYGLYGDYRQAYERMDDLELEAYCNHTDETFWIEEE